MGNELTDILVVGGGINGCAVARDAAGRGLSVVLCEKNDLASGTSSASTKLIHGGLRYLEHFAFSLVHKSLVEREVLLKMAPHLVQRLRFILPHSASIRPAWLVRLGLFLYDHLGGRPANGSTRAVRLDAEPFGGLLQAAYRKGYEYSDCRVDDSRLVIMNALDASLRGASILTRTQFVACSRHSDHWQVRLKSTEAGEHLHLKARTIVYATGAWTVPMGGPQEGPDNMTLVKGSHIIVRSLYAHDRAFIFQSPDGRVVFTIPYETHFTLIGTTDELFTGNPDDVRIGDGEVAYLCRAVNQYLKVPLSADDVVHSFSGVRTLHGTCADSPEQLRRDYLLATDGCDHDGGPGQVRVIGGKVTTARLLAEDVMDAVGPCFPGMGRPWTRTSRLPGGDFEPDEFEITVDQIHSSHPSLSREYIRCLMRRYGTCCRAILAGVHSPDHLGPHFGGALYGREVTYLIDNEWAKTAEDVVWRRSKLGLTLTSQEVGQLGQFIERYGSTRNRGGEIQQTTGMSAFGHR